MGNDGRKTEWLVCEDDQQEMFCAVCVHQRTHTGKGPLSGELQSLTWS